MHIAKPKDSAYQAADGLLREFLDLVVAELNAHGNWKVRKKKFLDFLDVIELGFEANDLDELNDEMLDQALVEKLDDQQLDELERKARMFEGLVERMNDTKPPPSLPGLGAEPEAEDFEDDLEEPLTFQQMLPFFVGAVLERLDEEAITCTEQTAFYSLSCHVEHMQAAQQWLEQDWRNVKAFRKFLRDNPRYAELLEMMEDEDESEE